MKRAYNYRIQRMKQIDRVLDTLEVFRNHGALTYAAACKYYPNRTGSRKAMLELHHAGVIAQTMVNAQNSPLFELVDTSIMYEYVDAIGQEYDELERLHEDKKREWNK
jgi:hypothetical protein